MRFQAEEYRRAGLERMQQARRLHELGRSYALAMYCGGLAVECTLRAFRWTTDESFEGRHDLMDLFKASGLQTINEERLRRAGLSEAEVEAIGRGLRTAVVEVNLLWHNNLRYASEARLRAFLGRIDRLRGIRGDPLKKNSADLLNAAQTVIDRGENLWTSKRS